MIKIHKKLLIIIVIIVVIGTAFTVLANVKGPSTSKNLLSYILLHSKSRECKIVEQDYKEVAKNIYDTECVEIKCSEEYPNTKTGMLTDYNSELGSCKWANSNGQYDELLKDCFIKVEKSQVPTYSETNGRERKNYYLGIPVTIEFCPTGYKAE